MGYPQMRPRRLRRTPAIRRMLAEARLDAGDLVLPVFVKEGLSEPAPIGSLPGVFQHTLGSARKLARRALESGLAGVLIFGVPTRRDPMGIGASDPQGISQAAIREIREEVGDELAVFADLCLDEYTDHGHCGIVLADGRVDNDSTLERYAEIALAQAEAGAHFVAPSGMMDGQVAAIRRALDEGGFEEVGILAYSAKYASGHYGPFRDAVEVRIAQGDRRSYQQDPPNRREALREVLLDVEEGADIVMVKPAISYLDVIAAVRQASVVPLAAYHTSGEYAMVKAAAERGWIDGQAVMAEHLVSIKRAGADLIISYAAEEVLGSLGG